MSLYTLHARALQNICYVNNQQMHVSEIRKSVNNYIW